MDEKTRKKIIFEYKKGKSSIDIIKIVKLSKKNGSFTTEIKSMLK